MSARRSAGETEPILLDCGATSLVALKRQGIDPNRVAAVLVSHLHVDHYGGLPQLILDGQFNRRVAPLTIAGPVGTTDRLAAALEVMFPGSSTARRRFDVKVIKLQPGNGEVSLDNAAVHAVEVDHGMPGNTALGPSRRCRRQDHRLQRGHRMDRCAHRTGRRQRHADLVAHREQLAGRHIILTHMSADMLARTDDAAFDLAYDGRLVDL